MADLRARKQARGLVGGGRLSLPAVWLNCARWRRSHPASLAAARARDGRGRGLARICRIGSLSVAMSASCEAAADRPRASLAPSPPAPARPPGPERSRFRPPRGAATTARSTLADRGADRGPRTEPAFCALTWRAVREDSKVGQARKECRPAMKHAPVRDGAWTGGMVPGQGTAPRRTVRKASVRLSLPRSP
jgi:hypothetical protein